MLLHRWRAILLWQEQVLKYLQHLKNMNLKNPVLVGFGVKDKQSFESACKYTSGAIIGTAAVCALLEILMRNAGRIVTKTMLLERVWDFNFDPKTTVVETHMSRLRAKLPTAGIRIVTVRGAGYRLEEA